MNLIFCQRLVLTKGSFYSRFYLIMDKNKNVEEFVVKVNGRQQRVKIGSKLVCDRLHAEEGAQIELPVIAFLDSVEGLNQCGIVKAKILKHYLGEKVRFFHKTARGGDRNMGKSSRPRHTDILIEEVVRG